MAHRFRHSARARRGMEPDGARRRGVRPRSGATRAAASSDADSRRRRRSQPHARRRRAMRTGSAASRATADTRCEIGGRSSAAGAVGEHHREPERRLLRHRTRRRIHVGGEQLLLSAHAVVQRSGERSVRRGALSARRRERTRVDADARAGAGRSATRRRCADRTSCARAGRDAVHARARGIATRAVARRAASRPGEDRASCGSRIAARAPRRIVAHELRRAGHLARSASTRGINCTRGATSDTGAVFARELLRPTISRRASRSRGSASRSRSSPANREEFIGRNGDLARRRRRCARTRCRARPARGSTPARLCGACSTLEPGETREVVVLLGAATSEDEARAIIGAPCDSQRPQRGGRCGGRAWDARLTTITARTPSPEFDAMVNRWSLYQALSCRMWARSALYQSSGAYGFRDQLQDCMAFVYAEPAIARAHLLRCAGRQFVEGDVQHWWHEPSGRGVRTRFSDDLAWLPFVADHYVTRHGRRGVLGRARCLPRACAPLAPRRAGSVRSSRSVSDADARRSTSIACARSTARAPRARTACR